MKRAASRKQFPISTWHDYAASEPVANPYAIGGCREVTADRWIIGSFTDTLPAPASGGPAEAKVYFFKFRTDLPLARGVGRN